MSMLFALIASIDSGAGFPLRDFVEYWSAARVATAGGNPYDGTQLLPWQRLADGDPTRTQATMLWTPPWTLPLYLPFGLLDPAPAHLAWLVVQSLLVLVSVYWLWIGLGGPMGQTRNGRLLWPLVPLGIALTFAPNWWLLGYGQNTGFLLFGIGGFLRQVQRGRPIRAGLFAAFTAVKPHLLGLYGLVMILEMSRASGRKVVLGGIIVLAIGSVIAVAVDPAVFRQFHEGITRPHSHESPAVTDWQLPLISYKLRWWFDPEHGKPFAMQFLLIGLGMLAVLPYYAWRRKNWSWPRELPGLVALSLLLAPYGGWIFDLVLLQVPVLAVWIRAIRDGRLIPITVTIAGHVVLFALAAMSRPLHDYLFATPAVLAWCLLVVGLTRFTVPGVGTSPQPKLGE